MTQAVSLAQLGNNNTTFRNRIINGNFDFWQRGTTGTGAVYVADRWSTDQVNTTQARSTDVPSGIGADYSLQVSASSGTNATVQKIESKNVRDLSNKQVTVSFWAKSASGTPTLNFDVRYATVLDNFASMTIMQGSTVTLSSTWTKYTFTFNALNSNVVNGLALFFYNVSTQTFLLSQIQLEAGTTATPFEYRSYGVELALCQRYYQLLGGGLTTSGNLVITLGLFCPMRATPTVTTSTSGTGGTFGVWTTAQGGNTQLVQGGNHSTNSSATVTAAAEL